MSKLQGKKIVSVTIVLESGCDASNGEYELYINSFIGELNISKRSNEIDLITECIENDFDFNRLPDEGFIQLILVSESEREDMYINRYFKIESFNFVEFK